MTCSGDARDRVRRILEVQKLAVLSTQGGGQPFGNLVAFSFTEDLGLLVFATPAGTNKYRRVIAEPRVSLLVDNRTNGEVDFREGVAVTALGEARLVGPTERDVLAALHLSRHPSLRDFLSTPGCAVLRVDVGRYLVSGFQEVEEVRIRDFEEVDARRT